jgi:hypothetical protein
MPPESKIIGVKIAVDSLCLSHSNNPFPMRKKDLIDRLLLERISLAGIARSIPISESWLQAYVNQK